MRESTVHWRTALHQRLAARRVDPTLHVAVIEELAQHLEDRYQSLLARGLSAAEAEQSVLQELEDDEALERELRRAERALPVNPPVLGAEQQGAATQPPRRPGLLESWWQDVRYAARALRKAPGFTAVAAITLALGVGANTAIFSVVNAVMLRPLDYADADRLIRIWESNPEKGWPQFSASHPNFLDWRTRMTSVEAMAATTGASFAMTSSQGAEIVRGASVTHDFLPTLGAVPALGRRFTADEDRPGGDTRVTILSDGFWRRRFGGARSVLGQTIALNGTSYTVIGVLPASFTWGAQLDVLVPLAPDPARRRDDHRLTVIARLKEGVTIDQAHSELASITAALGEQYPDSNRGWTVRLSSFYDWIVPADIRQSLLVLLGAVGLVLLIGCGNVANLLLARGAGRQKELSIRVALGAQRWRIVGQLLTESLLLALVGGAAGLAMGAGATRLLVAYGPASVPRLSDVSFDLRVLGFALAASVAAAFLFGTLPAIQISRQRPADALRDATRGSSGGAGRQRLRSALTVAEISLSVALLIGAGLLLRSFSRLQEVDPGYYWPTRSVHAGSTCISSASLPGWRWFSPPSASTG